MTATPYYFLSFCASPSGPVGRSHRRQPDSRALRTQECGGLSAQGQHASGHLRSPAPRRTTSSSRPLTLYHRYAEDIALMRWVKVSASSPEFIFSAGDESPQPTEEGSPSTTGSSTSFEKHGIEPLVTISHWRDPAPPGPRL